jgi:Rod binding domain-containing protein
MTDRTDSLSLRADRTRNHLSDLVDNLQHQMMPAELVNQLVGYRRTNRGAGVADTIASQISRNPLACLLIAAGVGWLMWSDRVASNPRPQRRRAVARRAAAKKRRPRQRKTA